MAKRQRKDDRLALRQLLTERGTDNGDNKAKFSTAGQNAVLILFHREE
jgi:hypothetical protein